MLVLSIMEWYEGTKSFIHQLPRFRVVLLCWVGCALFRSFGLLSIGPGSGGEVGTSLWRDTNDPGVLCAIC